MDEPPVEGVCPHPPWQKLSDEGERGPVNERMVRLVREHDPDVHPRQGGDLEGVQDALVGDKVGGLDVDVPSGHAHQLQVLVLYWHPRIVGPRAHHLHRHSPRSVEGGEECLVDHTEALLGGIVPVEQEADLQGPHRLALHPSRVVSPGAQGALAQILHPDVEAAHEADSAVYDRDLAVGVVVEPEGQVGDEGLVEQGSPPSRGVEGLVLFLRYIAAQAIQQQSDLYSLTGLPGQQVHQFVAQPIVAKDVVLQVYVVLRSLDGLEQGVELVLSFIEHPHPGRPQHRRIIVPQEHAHQGESGPVPPSPRPLHLILMLSEEQLDVPAVLLRFQSEVFFLEVVEAED